MNLLCADSFKGFSSRDHFCSFRRACAENMIHSSPSGPHQETPFPRDHKSLQDAHDDDDDDDDDDDSSRALLNRITQAHELR